MFEDWSVDADQAGDEPAAQTPVSRSTFDLDRRLLDTLVAHRGRGGIYPTVPRLAGLLGVSISTVQRSLRRLVAGGLAERVAVYELLDDEEWQRRGHRISHKGRQTSNSYRLAVTPAPGVTASREPAAQTPVSPDFVTPLEEKEQPASKERRVSNPPVSVVLQPGDLMGALCMAAQHEQCPGRWPGGWPGGPPPGVTVPCVCPCHREPPPVVEVGRQHPPDRLDHDPTRSEVLATLRAGFGEVEVIGPPRFDGRRPVYRPAGKDARPLPLAGDLADFHAAEDALDADTVPESYAAKVNGRRRRRT